MLETLVFIDLRPLTNGKLLWLPVAFEIPDAISIDLREFKLSRAWLDGWLLGIINGSKLGCAVDVMGNCSDLEIEEPNFSTTRVRKFHLRANAHRKGMNPPPPQLMFN